MLSMDMSMAWDAMLVICTKENWVQGGVAARVDWQNSYERIKEEKKLARELEGRSMVVIIVENRSGNASRGLK
eukprot:m.87463 g.87463  ORF g.87463 m.87463 type:complete len:73 (+) comp12831_c0_seq2:1043-1261(+)